MTGRFSRVEMPQRFRGLLQGLLAELPHKNCWTITEHAGDANPYGMQYLLGRALWDTDQVRDDLRGYVVEHLGGQRHGNAVPVDDAALAVDEKSQIQPLDRSASVPPMMPGMPERRTHDYLRNGITILFAALDVASGQIIGSIHRRHRAAEFRKFPTKIDKQVLADLEVHLICDNYGTHKHPTFIRWLDAHPRFHMHFTPAYCSWLNQVERWLGLLTQQRLQ
ncbi:hypothetical protein GCM10009678_72180 [Actinomadura kijaniata]